MGLSGDCVRVLQRLFRRLPLLYPKFTEARPYPVWSRGEVRSFECGARNGSVSETGDRRIAKTSPSFMASFRVLAGSPVFPGRTEILG